MSSPIVSVIVPCYNAAPYIEETLDSAYGQRGVDLEVIVVDDGSSDDSASRVASRFPHARLERTPNRGPSAARNLGTSLSTGRFIQYLDADDLLGPDKLARQLQSLEETRADIAYGDWVRFSADSSGKRLKEEPVSRQLGPAVDIDMFQNFWCPPAAYLLRREIVDKTGGWNPRLPVIQDARFMLDCALQGARFVRSPGVMAYYRVHHSGSVSTRSAIAFERDRLTNTIEIHQWWSSHGQLDGPRLREVVESCRHIAVANCRRDPDTYRRAREFLLQVAPDYVPDEPWRMRIAAQLLGAGRALSIESCLQRYKWVLGR